MLDTQTIHAPELPTNLRWLNAPPIRLKQLRGKVVLVDFWDYTCVNCVRTLPYVTEWATKYAPQGLVTIGVHAPEFAFAREHQHIQKACTEFGITYPVVLDNDFAIWQAFGNNGWPSKFLIDAQGYVRYNHTGEGEYLATEMAIQLALREANPNFTPVAFTLSKRTEDAPGAMCYRPTPELHLGYERSDVGNPEGVEKGVTLMYADAGVREGKHVYAHGAWRSQDEYIELVGNHGHLAFRYKAKEVNAVLSPTGNLVELALHGQGAVLLDAPAPRMEIWQDGVPLPAANAGADMLFDENGHAFVQPTHPRMYKLVNNPDFEEHDLKLICRGTGFAAFAISFTTCVAAK